MITSNIKYMFLFIQKAQRVSVRSVATGSPQQSHSISPQRHPDHLQQYYSQLTPGISYFFIYLSIYH